MPTYEYVFDDGFRTCEISMAMRYHTIHLVGFRKRNLVTGAWVVDV